MFFINRRRMIPYMLKIAIKQRCTSLPIFTFAQLEQSLKASNVVLFYFDRAIYIGTKHQVYDVVIRLNDRFGVERYIFSDAVASH